MTTQKRHLVNIIFHIGYHKTASSWLQEIYFTNHPDINLINNYFEPWNDPLTRYLVKTKEGNFNAKELVGIFQNMLSASGEKKNNIVISSERLSGFPYSGGYDSHMIASRIHEAFPKAKILIIIRNQIDMINSIYKQLVREGCLATLDNLLSTRSWKTASFDLDFYCYELLIEKCFQLFGKNNVVCLPYEYMKAHTEAFANDICTKLKFQHYYSEVDNKLIRSSLSNKQVRMQRYINYLYKSEYNAYPIIDLRWGRQYVLKPLSKLAFLLSEKEIMDNAIKETLCNYYEGPNNRLQDITGLDLKAYNYPIKNL